MVEILKVATARPVDFYFSTDGREVPFHSFCDRVKAKSGALCGQLSVRQPKGIENEKRDCG